MNDFRRDILDQPEALARLVGHYRNGTGAAALAGTDRPSRVVLTGMGASYHAALWGAHALQARGIWALAVEASELLHYGGVLLDGADAVIFISQSGASAEVIPLLDRLPPGCHVVGITNDRCSPLAMRAATHLDLVAGRETTVACKTYLNTLACLWLLAGQWRDSSPDAALRDIEAVSGGVAALIDDGDAVAEAWIERLGEARMVVFAGHGPHVASARQGAMMMGEWLKRAALGTGIGAFRHGMIEIVDETTAVVLLGAGGRTGDSVSKLASDLRSYGATVLDLVEGRIAGSAGGARTFAEQLSPLLDVVPMQLCVEAAARRSSIPPVFRHISKVVASL